jgi:hypothetical protein
VGYRGYLQADAYAGYDAFFKDPARGLIEVGCWGHARRYYYKALDSDEPHMGPALFLIAQLYQVEERAQSLTAEERWCLRKSLIPNDTNSRTGLKSRLGDSGSMRRADHPAFTILPHSAWHQLLLHMFGLRCQNRGFLLQQ